MTENTLIFWIPQTTEVKEDVGMKTLHGQKILILGEIFSGAWHKLNIRTGSFSYLKILI